MATAPHRRPYGGDSCATRQWKALLGSSNKRHIVRHHNLNVNDHKAELMPTNTQLSKI